MNFSQIAYNYLRVCKIQASKDYFELRIKSHPNYPALLSLTDTLNELGLENKAVQAEEKYIPQFSFPFLAQTPKAVNGFEIVPSIEYYEQNKEKFLNRWEGIAVMVTPGQTINNDEHKDFVKKKNGNEIRLIFAIAAGLIFYSLVTVLNFHPAFSAFSFLSICGIAICSLIILHKFGKSNSLTQQLCNAAKSHNCDLVLSSKASEIIKGVHFGDIGFIYFSGILFYYLFSSIAGFDHNALALLIIPSSIALVFSFFSLYYQWKVVKAWCKMCLITIAIIWLQAMVSFIYVAEAKQIIFNPQLLLPFSLAFLLAFCWLLIKPLIKSKLDEKERAINLLKWKRNPDIFEALLLRQPVTDTFISNNPVQLGKVNAPLQFTIVSNPFCRPCAIAHHKLEKLFEKHPKQVSISVIFLVRAASDKEDRITIAVGQIIDTLSTNKDCPGVLHDWFVTMDLKKWEQKYPLSKTYKDTDSILHSYQHWIRQNGVPHTPFVYLNGCQVPKQYDISDMDSFIIELSDRLINVETREKEKEEATL